MWCSKPGKVAGSRLQCSAVALLCCSINTEPKQSPATKNHYLCSIQRKLDCWGMLFQLGYCSTLNIVKVNYQKRRTMCMVQSIGDSNSRGGHSSPSIFHISSFIITVTHALRLCRLEYCVTATRLCCLEYCVTATRLCCLEYCVTATRLCCLE